MLDFCLFSFTDAFQHVKDNITETDGAVSETDLVFLKGLLESPAVKQMIKVRMESREKMFTCEMKNSPILRSLRNLISYEW